MTGDMWGCLILGFIGGVACTVWFFWPALTEWAERETRREDRNR